MLVHTNALMGSLDMRPFVEEINRSGKHWHSVINQAAAQRALLPYQTQPPEDLEQKFIEAAKKLATLGWTVPMAMTPRGIFLLSEQIDAAEVDAQFVGFYRRDGRDALPGRGFGSARLARWNPLLEQCSDSYRRGNYLICIPSLITVLEGAIALPEEIEFIRGQDRQIFFKGKIDDCGDDLLMRALWESMDTFVSHLFQYAGFDTVRPLRINRHWILHGRDLPDWKQADALRLFQALETLCILFP